MLSELNVSSTLSQILRIIRSLHLDTRQIIERRMNAYTVTKKKALLPTMQEVMLRKTTYAKECLFR